MHPVLPALLGRRPVDLQLWRSFWNQLDARRLQPGEAAIMLGSLSTQLPDAASVAALLGSLAERQPAIAVRYDRAVNVVGTGGGAPTFNISTAAAFVASAAGIPVIKTGSRAYTSRHGSYDLLDRLGIRRTTSHPETVEVLDRVGIAFTGDFIYPRELGQLARAVLPFDLRTLGGALNVLGPLLAAVPVGAQLTGVSDRSLLPALRAAADAGSRSIWLCANDLGTDELLPFTDNFLLAPGAIEPVQLPVPATASGALADLVPVRDDALLAEHFTDVLAGRAGPVATETVCLNAAAVAVVSGSTADWPAALAAARDAVTSGAASDLLKRATSHPVLSGAANDA